MMGDMSPSTPAQPVTIGDQVAVQKLEEIRQALAADSCVKVAGIDCDGVLRGKIMAKDKFLSGALGGFGMSSAIFEWDMHDVLYSTQGQITNTYSDFLARPDLQSYRRIPWEDNIPFFLLSFSTSAGKSVKADGRSLLHDTCQDLRSLGYSAMAGSKPPFCCCSLVDCFISLVYACLHTILAEVAWILANPDIAELEFTNFQTPSQDGYQSKDDKRDIATFLSSHAPSTLRPLTGGMFGYSISRQAMNKKYFYDIFNMSSRFDCNLEAWHTESGPGVFEAAIKVTDVEAAADRVSLFKLLAKSVAMEHQITPCFMAKPVFGLPGNSGHIHISFVDRDGTNVFARTEHDDRAKWPDIADLSDIGRQFLAGLLEALPDIMPLLAPTINSFKRLVENYWAPVHVSWGLEDRLSSIRLIAPPVSSPQATRFEVRVPGADLQPHYAMSAILAAGMRGIKEQLEIPVPPTALRDDEPARLPSTLAQAVALFKAESSKARLILGDEFVDFFAASREHELSVWNESVTDWEVKRYIETV